MQKKMVLSLILFFLYNVLMFRSLMPVMDRCQTNVSCQSHPFADGKKSHNHQQRVSLPPSCWYWHTSCLAALPFRKLINLKSNHIFQVGHAECTPVFLWM